MFRLPTKSLANGLLASPKPLRPILRHRLPTPPHPSCPRVRTIYAMHIAAEKPKHNNWNKSVTNNYFRLPDDLLSPTLHPSIALSFPPRHQSPEKSLEGIPLQEVLTQHLKPGLILVQNPDKKCVLCPMRDGTPNYRDSNRGRGAKLIYFKDTAPQEYFKLMLWKAHFFLTKKWNVEFHIKISSKAPSAIEEFCRATIMYRPDVIMKAMPEGTYYQIYPYMSQKMQEVVWVFGNGENERKTEALMEAFEAKAKGTWDSGKALVKQEQDKRKKKEKAEKMRAKRAKRREEEMAAKALRTEMRELDGEQGVRDAGSSVVEAEKHESANGQADDEQWEPHTPVHKKPLNPRKESTRKKPSPWKKRGKIGGVEAADGGDQSDGWEAGGGSGL